MDIKSDELISIENNFRVSAGPGAGKTYWLVNHIKNVLYNSKRLMKTRKIACITYTNIAVETINERLGNSSDQVEVSTIHSFLYSNVIKPYISFIANDYDLDIKKMDGHEDVKVKFSNVKEWIENLDKVDDLKNPNTKNQLLKIPEQKKALINWLESIKYKIDSNGNLYASCDNSKALVIIDNKPTRIKKSNLSILEPELIKYKKLYWKNGIIDHEDVLFFSYNLIKEYPFILEVLRAKYPYFFVDEFQDTNPIQVELIKMIAANETIVGVIGDSAQSIYSFQGADSKEFSKFKINNLADYKIKGNRRSTNCIIKVLNSMRKDFEQISLREVEGSKPIIIVGDVIQSVRKGIELCNSKEVTTLSRDNVTANAIKKGIEDKESNHKLIELLIEIDGNKKRKNTIIRSITAIELAKEGNFKEALKTLNNITKVKDNKKESLKYLSLLLNKYDEYCDESLMNLYELIKSNFDSSLTNFKNGKPKEFYNGHKYKELAICINQIEDKSNNKTIHQSKGDEFENVILIKKDKNLDFLLNPDLKKNEEHRIDYVAISRAKDNLMINIQYLSQEDEEKLKNLFQIIRLS
ncbi:MAG: ATP-dependent helicase [Clostridium baratii]|nr:ATP-dependent helicase [Clostridium baratii]